MIWVNTPGVIGIFVLMALTAVASVMYFLRRNRAASTPTTIAAGVVSAALLVVAIVVMVDNIALVTGASRLVNGILIALIPVTVIVGLVLAVWLRRNRPGTYARIGEGQDSGDIHAASEDNPVVMP
jgi:hypothetical protein